MIFYGNREYVNELKNLWHNVFGDEWEYLDAFFAEVYQEDNTLVYIKNHEIVGALYMIPYDMVIEGSIKPIVYLYALATKPEYRRQGIMSDLINESIRISTERGYYLSVLIPDSRDLFGFYEKFGYEELFSRTIIKRTREEIEINIGNIIPNQLIENNHEKAEIEIDKQKDYKEVNRELSKDMFLKKGSIQELWEIYSNSNLITQEGIILSKAQFDFYLRELEREGGEGIVLYSGRDILGYALIRCEEDELIIIENTISEGLWDIFSQVLIDKYNFREVILYQPTCFSKEEIIKNRSSFAMGRKLKDIDISDPYINCVLM